MTKEEMKKKIAELNLEIKKLWKIPNLFNFPTDKPLTKEQYENYKKSVKLYALIERKETLKKRLRALECGFVEPIVEETMKWYDPRKRLPIRSGNVLVLTKFGKHKILPYSAEYELFDFHDYDSETFVKLATKIDDIVAWAELTIPDELQEEMQTLREKSITKKGE